MDHEKFGRDWYDLEKQKRRRLLIGVSVLGLFVLGLLYLVIRPYADPLAWFQQMAITRLPIDDPDYLYAIAQRSYQEGDKRYAADVARRMIIVDSRNIVARKFLARIALSEKDYAEAKRRCDEVLVLAPRDLGARMALASVYRGMHKPDEARALYRSITEDSSNTNEDRAVAQSALEDMDGRTDTAAPSSTPSPLSSPVAAAPMPSPSPVSAATPGVKLP